MTRSYTAQQQRAICANGKDICVAAGAGSGKTGVLVERFVRLITESKAGVLPNNERAGVDEILVITFTEKATKEMKARIVAELNRQGLVEERRQVETAYISTIHGFCSRLLQENPFEAGVDPQFSVLEERQSRRLLRQTFEGVIERAYEQGDTEITELVAATQAARLYGEDASEPLAALAQAVESTLAKLRGAGRQREECELHWRRGCDVTTAVSNDLVWSFLTPVLTEIRAAIESIELLRAGAMGTIEIACRTLLERAIRFVPRATSLPETLSALEETLQAVSRARPRAASTSDRDRDLYTLLQRIKILCEEARSLYGTVADREEQAGLFCHRLLGLTLSVWADYDRIKRRRGKLDNDDLQAEGVRVLETAPQVRARYRRRFHHLMIDEFQDTNPLQMRLIDLLHAPDTDAAPGTVPTNYLFVVGDVQQSIYGFRHADSTLFQNMERAFREEAAGDHVPLATNFRSRPELLRTVAHVFKHIWREESTPFVPLTAGAAFDPKTVPSLEILLTQDITRRDYVRLEAEALAARIQQLVEGQELALTAQSDARRGQPVAYRDIAILLRSLTDVQKYEEAFARRGLPYFIVGGGRGYYARHEIRDILNVLTVLDTPLDDVALAATLRSPVVGVDLDTLYRIAQRAKHPGVPGGSPAPSGHVARRQGREPLYLAMLALLEERSLPETEATKLRDFVTVIEPLRAQEDRMPVGHLLERLIAQTHYDARLLCRPEGRRRLANVRKLLQMANADSVLGVRDFIGRLRDLEKLSDREGDAPTEEEAADVVRFLTIHSAKGLEFPVVVLADLSRSLLVPERGLFVCDPQHLAFGTKLGGEPNVVYKAIQKRREEADKQEYARLLYVAMTRPREHLILCGNLGRNPGFNWADNLFSLLGVSDPPPQPEVQRLIGGLTAQVAPMSYYVHAPLTGASGTTRQSRTITGDRIAEAILHDEPLNTLL